MAVCRGSPCGLPARTSLVRAALAAGQGSVWHGGAVLDRRRRCHYCAAAAEHPRRGQQAGCISLCAAVRAFTRLRRSAARRRHVRGPFTPRARCTSPETCAPVDSPATLARYSRSIYNRVRCIMQVPHDGQTGAPGPRFTPSPPVTLPESPDCRAAIGTSCWQGPPRPRV